MADKDEKSQAADEQLMDTGGAAAPPIPGLKEGMMIGNFKLKRKLGRGGMGEVWLAHQEAMERDVALKLLSPVFVQEENFIKRFLKEAKLYGKLEHSNIVAAHDAGMDNGFYYLAMSYVDGEDLSIRRKRENVIEEKDALIITKKIAQALKYAWDSAKILHRDIKPSNIMLTKGGEPKLMDMGISKTLSDDSSMTMTGAIVGTPYYISPEQARANKDIDFRVDIYSLGATLYHIVTGDLPFKAATSMGILSKLITENPKSPIEVNPKLSPGCSLLIEIMMAKNQDERQASWEEVIQDIDAVIAGNMPLTPAPSVVKGNYPDQTQQKPKQKPRSKNKPLYIAASIVLVAIIIAVVLVVIIKKHKQRQMANAGNSVSRKSPDKRPGVVLNIPEDNSHGETEDNNSTVLTPTTTEKTEPVKKTPDTIPVKSPDRTPIKTTDTARNEKEKKILKTWESAVAYAHETIEKNGDFDRAIKRFEIIKNNLDAIEYKIKAEEEIDSLENARQKAIDNTIDELHKTVKVHIDNQDFEKAADIYSSYSGKFAEETQPIRSSYAEKCYNAKSEFDKLLKEVANDLLIKKGIYSSLSRKQILSMNSLNMFFPKQIETLKNLFAGLRKIRSVILDSFKDQVDQVVKMKLSDGWVHPVLIKRLERNKIYGEEKQGDKNVELIIDIDKLPVGIISQRLKGVDPFTKNVYLGYLKVQNGDFSGARSDFDKSGFLSGALNKNLVLLEKKAKEMEAGEKLMALIKKAGLNPIKLSTMAIRDELGSKLLSPEHAKALIKDLDEYSKQYKTTAFVNDSTTREIIKELKVSAEGSIERGKRGGPIKLLPDKKDDAVLNIFKATQEATDLFSEDERKKKK